MSPEKISEAEYVRLFEGAPPRWEVSPPSVKPWGDGSPTFWRHEGIVAWTEHLPETYLGGVLRVAPGGRVRDLVAALPGPVYGDAYRSVFARVWAPLGARVREAFPIDVRALPPGVTVGDTGPDYVYFVI